MVEASKAVFRPRVADVPVCRGGPRGVADLQSLRLDRLLRVILERRDDIGPYSLLLTPYSLLLPHETIAAERSTSGYLLA